MTDSTERPALGRRHLLGGAAVVGVTAPLLAACGSTSSSSGGSTGGSGTPGPSGSTDGSSGSGPTDLVSAADVPVGGGVILDGPQVVVTQPSKGDFKGFSAVCTHAGCLVGTVAGGKITCPCHGSQYSIEDGSVLGGPAPAPLPAVPVSVKDGEVVRS